MSATDATAGQFTPRRARMSFLDATLLIFERVLPAVAANVASLRAELTKAAHAPGARLTLAEPMNAL